MSTELAVLGVDGVEVSRGWTPEGLQLAIEREKALRQIVVQYYRSAMQEGHHYYTLQPGQKPALSKEGALNLASLFKVRLALSEPHEVYEADHHYTVRYRVDLVNLSGEVMASGDGLCTTHESKYAYRWAFASEIPTHLDRASLEARERESKKGGKYTQYKVPNADLPDLWNTVLKMALKRAVVDGVLKLPMASELFTQDLEETVQGARTPKRPATTTSADPETNQTNAVEAEHRALLLQMITTLLKTHFHHASPEAYVRFVPPNAMTVVRQAFGVQKWAELKHKSVGSLQEGYGELLQQLEPDTPYEGDGLDDEEAMAETEQERLDQNAPLGTPRMAESTQRQPDTLNAMAPAEGDAGPVVTEVQMEELKTLAQLVGEDAYADVQDLIEHHKGQVTREVYEIVKSRLKGRQHPS